MMKEEIISCVLRYYPDVQAIYIFGSLGTEYELPDSDADVGLLFHPEKASSVKCLALSDLSTALSDILHKTMDIINMRLVSTVFQKEIISEDRAIYCSDNYARQEFEMLVLSYYQKLNEERKEILKDFYATKRAYRV